MEITYIGHSGVMVETEKAVLLFDCVAKANADQTLEYAPGVLPDISKEKPLIVFASHRHQDHYSFSIWKMKDTHPDVTYVLAKEIPFSPGVRASLGIEEEDLPKIHRMKAHECTDLMAGGTPLHIETLRSNDCGVAFYVEVDGYSIFHTGDLHLWQWEDEGTGYVENMKTSFWQEVNRLKDKHVDVAFLILDPRLDNELYRTAFEGIDGWRNTVDMEHIFPIHMWKQYDFCDTYIRERPESQKRGEFHRISCENEVFHI